MSSAGKDLTKTLMASLKKYKVVAILGVFVSFFVVVGILNYFQRVTLETFVCLNNKNNKENFQNNYENNEEGEKYENNEGEEEEEEEEE